MGNPVRLIIDPPARGSWNMAVDQALLETAAAGDQATLRVYRWTPATLSLGYFQSSSDRLRHIPSAGCSVVRRASGGGAIVHDDELTYSLALPASNRWARDNANLFRRVHRTFIDCLQSLGISGSRMVERVTAETRSEPFLCFQRRACGDVVLGDFKIMGSAQRRMKAALLQHGSLLLGKSSAAPELPGINQLSDGPELRFEQLASDWPARIAVEFGWDTRPAGLDDAERASADRIEAACFGACAWTNKR